MLRVSECSSTEKKKDIKKMKKESKIYSNWRENWEYLDGSCIWW